MGTPNIGGGWNHQLLVQVGKEEGYILRGFPKPQLEVLGMMGINVDLEIIRRGYYPKGKF